MPVGELMQGLQGRFGRELHVGPRMLIDQERIDAFAEVTGDRQWIHVDRERTRRESPYVTTVVHGFLTLSLPP
jgi:acyl dehydratase